MQKTVFILVALSLFVSACGSLFSSSAQATPTVALVPTPQPSLPTQPAASPTPEYAPTLPPYQGPRPADKVPYSVFRTYDADSISTGAQGYAPYGERYDFNLFERPFDANMTYLPSLDIHAFELSYDETWYYITIELNTPYNDAETVVYAVEFDTDLDGFGNYILAAMTPRETTWSMDFVWVVEDANHDTGGVPPTRSDAPFQGDGYETIIFDQGWGDIPGLAWSRLSPTDSKRIEFAIQRSFLTNKFMLGVSADAGWVDPNSYDYNDRISEAQAGSPLRNNPNYPLKDLYAYDNTCRQAFGFDPNGLEPRICPTEPPTPTPTLEPFPVCTNPEQYPDPESCWSAGCAWVYEEPVGYCIYAENPNP